MKNEETSSGEIAIKTIETVGNHLSQLSELVTILSKYVDFGKVSMEDVLRMNEIREECTFSTLELGMILPPPTEEKE